MRRAEGSVGASWAGDALATATMSNVNSGLFMEPYPVIRDSGASSDDSTKLGRGFTRIQHEFPRSSTLVSDSRRCGRHSRESATKCRGIFGNAKESRPCRCGRFWRFMEQYAVIREAGASSDDSKKLGREVARIQIEFTRISTLVQIRADLLSFARIRVQNAAELSETRGE